MAEQLVCNIIIAAARYFLIAIGLLVIFRTIRFFDLSYGALLTVCAYTASTLMVFFGGSLLWSTALAILTTVLVSVSLLYIAYLPLRRHGVSNHVMVVASLGLYIVALNVVSLVWGDSPRVLDSQTGDSLTLLGARITRLQIATIGISFLSWIMLYLLLHHTKLGKSMRAVGNDPELSRVSGIQIEKTILGAYVIGAVLAGLAGVLVAVDINMTPNIGMSALMMGIVILIIGGSKHISGMALAAAILAFMQHLAVWKVGPQWRDPIAFIILLAFLVLRPEGFLGKKVAKSSV